MGISDEQVAKLRSKLAGIPEVGEAEGELEVTLKSEADLFYKELEADEVVLFMLLSSLECYGKHKLLSQETIDQLAKDVFAKYLSAVGQAAPGVDEITEPVRGRLYRSLGSDGAKTVISRLKEAGIRS